MQRYALRLLARHNSTLSSSGAAPTTDAASAQLQQILKMSEQRRAERQAREAPKASPAAPTFSLDQVQPRSPPAERAPTASPEDRKAFIEARRAERKAREAAQRAPRRTLGRPDPAATVAASAAASDAMAATHTDRPSTPIEPAPSPTLADATPSTADASMPPRTPWPRDAAPHQQQEWGNRAPRLRMGDLNRAQRQRSGNVNTRDRGRRGARGARKGRNRKDEEEEEDEDEDDYDEELDEDLIRTPDFDYNRPLFAVNRGWSSHLTSKQERVAGDYSRYTPRDRQSFVAAAKKLGPVKHSAVALAHNQKLAAKYRPVIEGIIKKALNTKET
ncbi:hypothetical protein MKEN_01283300 [Mycena kentingensis (nom. inval.)]|nr:hypothetical protein MKEN_01283300 [Mycena kentingensis (nom. inval.)]